MKNLAFGVKTNRFGSDDTLPPGPGQYPIPGSCHVKNVKLPFASYKSQSPRDDVVVYPGGASPGVGKYNVEEHKTISAQQI